MFEKLAEKNNLRHSLASMAQYLNTCFMISTIEHEYLVNIEKGIVKNVSFYGESTYFYVKVEGINKLLMVSNFVDQVSINENDECYLGINLEDIKLVS